MCEFICLVISFLLRSNYEDGRVCWVPLHYLIPPHLCACPKTGPGLPTPYSMAFLELLNCLRAEKQTYHTVGTVQKSNRKTNIPHCCNSSKTQQKNKHTTLLEQVKNLTEKQTYHTVVTVQKSNRKTNIPHCCNSSKI